MASEEKHNTLFFGSEGSHIQWDHVNYAKDERIGLQGQVTDRPHATGDRGSRRVPIRFLSPWRSYQRRYDMKLDTAVSICQKIPATSQLFGVRKLKDSANIRQLERLNDVKSNYLLQCYEIFSRDDYFYTISEFSEITLNKIIMCSIIPSESQIASITYQILDAIISLNEHGISLSSLEGRDVLVLDDGNIKFEEAYRENLFVFEQPKAEATVRICQSLGRLMVTLMENEPPDNDHIELAEPSNWTRQAVDFLHSTASVNPKDLLKHAFLQGCPRTEEVLWLVKFAQASAKRSINK